MANFDPMEAEVAKKVTKQSPKVSPKAKVETKNSGSIKLAMWQKALITAGALVVLLFVLISAQPNDFVLDREIIITAPIAKVFDEVNDFHNWTAWSPWAKMDPNSTITVEQAKQGVGSVYHWIGSAKPGEGRMVITESEKNVHIAIEVDLSKPVEMKSAMKFVFVASGKDTSVKWTVTGKNSFMDKVGYLFGNSNSKLGAQLQEGLEYLKAATQPGYKAN